MFKDAIEEFYKCLMEKINQVVVADGKDVNVSCETISFNLLILYGSDMI